MVGMPTRNTNSAAAGLRFKPSSRAMKMAAAEREVPGNTPASTWARPTATAIFQVTASLGGPRSPRRSATSIQTPPITSAQATGVTVSGSSQPNRRTGRPTTAVTAKATAILSR